MVKKELTYSFVGSRKIPIRVFEMEVSMTVHFLSPSLVKKRRTCSEVIAFRRSHYGGMIPHPAFNPENFPFL